MINYLSIKNFALIEDVLLEFSEGLNILTGETGAGKTIVVEALGLVLGEKASVQQVRRGAARLAVAASFAASSARLKRVFQELGLVPDEKEGEILLRREVDAAGRSRCFVNDSPVNLSTLARVGEVLVDIHGQHEHQLLLREVEQRELLDVFGRLESQREAVLKAYAAWRDLTSEQQAISLSEQERAQRIDLYRFQRQELQAAQLKQEGEEEELERLLPQLKNAERLKNLGQEAYGLLYSNEGSALDNARRVQRDLETLQGLGADLNEVVGMAEEAVVRLEECAQRLEDFQEKVDLDPERLEEVLARMDRIGKLKRKYGPTIRDMMAYQKKIEEELRHLENVEERTRDLSQKLALAEQDLRESSLKLSQSRAAAARKLSAAVEKEFREVGLAQAGFEAAVEKNAEGSFSAAGMDKIQFRFTPNPGEGQRPLADVASGGELSRVMLALKTVLARVDAVSILVFDEIDAGVGGTLGAVLGKKLARLGKTHQVVCITHLAPIAACAQTHFSIEKEVKKDRTTTAVRKLAGDDRVAEIARMFGDRPESGGKSIGLRHARELLSASKA